MVSQVCGHRHCGSGDTMISVVEDHNSTCCALNLLLLFISKGHGLKGHSISNK